MTDVSSPSRQYDLMRTRWKQMRDCVSGSNAIKEAGTTYLPALSGHEISGSGSAVSLSSEYDDYKTRTLFYAATARTIDGLGGMVFRRPPIVDLPPAADDLRDDVDMMGRSIEDFSDAVLRENLTTGRLGILVDHTRPQEDFSEGEIGAGPAADLRPYMALYATEAILDTVYERIGGARKLVQARLLEAMEVPADDDEFQTDAVQIVRVLELVGGLYRQRVFVARADVDPRTKAVVTTWELDDELSSTPTLPDGKPLDFIPFWIVGTGASPVPGEIEPPPLLDLSDVNLAHYRQDADYRNCLHMNATPTPYCTGMQDPGTPVKFGSAQFLWFGDPAAKVGFLAYGAEGVGAIRQALVDLESQMAFLGARMLQPDRPGVEAAETARIHRMGEISVLARLSNVVSNSLTAAMRFMLEWSGIPTTDDHQVRLNDDFLPTQAPPQLLAEMVKSWQAGAISHDSLWRFAQEGELVDPRRSVEEEQALIADEDHIDAEREVAKRKEFPELTPPLAPPSPSANGAKPPVERQAGQEGA